MFDTIPYKVCTFFLSVITTTVGTELQRLFQKNKNRIRTESDLVTWFIACLPYDNDRYLTSGKAIRVKSQFFFLEFRRIERLYF